MKLSGQDTTIEALRTVWRLAIFMLDPPKATMLADRLAEALPELRHVGRVRK